MGSSDILYFKQLACKASIGIYAWEKHCLQAVFFDLEIAIDAANIARTDTITEAFDYDALSACIEGFLKNKHFNLIETLAERVAELLLASFPIAWLKLKLVKPKALKNAAETGVVIERKR